MKNDHRGIPVVVVRPGKIFASREPAWIRTLLGSCVSVCLCDSIAGVGGMNHIMLPGEGCERDSMLPARYGIHAMELLINGIGRLGGDRRRLVATAWGGADVLPVMHSSLSVAQANIAFVMEFLDREEIPVVDSLLGGVQAMRITLMSTTGAVEAEFVGKTAVKTIVQTEARLRSSVAKKYGIPPRRQVTIF